MLFFLYFALGLLANLIGPLAKQLNIDAKHSLKENKIRNWLYNYSLIIAIRAVMILIYPLFFFTYYILKKKPIEPISLLDKLDESVV